MNILSALLLSLAFPKFNLYILSFVALVPFLIGLTGKTKGLFRYGFIFGLIFMSSFHFWMWELVDFAPWYGVGILWVAASVYYGLFYGGISWLYGKLSHKTLSIWLFPACWVIGEWIKTWGIYGNPAGTIGYSQTSFLSFLQIGSWFGVWGVSFAVVLVNVLIFRIIVSDQKMRCFFLLCVILLGIICFGKFRIHNVIQKNYSYDSKGVAIIQANHAQMDKMNLKNAENITSDYFELSRKVKENVNFVVWPETIVPKLILDDPTFVEKVTHLCVSENFSVLFGAPYRLEQSEYYNSVAVIDKEGLHNIYSKRRLMPFGEYWPLRKWIEPYVDNCKNTIDYSVARRNVLLKSQKVSIGAAICLESIYSHYLMNSVQEGAKLLYVAANHAWFFHSSASEKHLQMSIMRAVENGRYLIQASNIGMSAIVSNVGKVEHQSRLDEISVVQGEVILCSNKTMYHRFGQYIIYICILIIGLIIFRAPMKDDPRKRFRNR